VGAGSSARILLADSHRVMRQTLSAAIEEEPGWMVCGEATTAGDLVAKAVGLAPDVIVMDVGLAGLDAVTLVRALRKAIPTAAILVVAVYESRALSVQLQDAGAKGYLLKPDVGHSLAPAIHALLGHGTFFRDRLQPEADLGPDENPQEDPLVALTAREREVLRLLAGGKSNKEIAAALNISVNTVETHRARVMNKLDLHSMNAVVRYALRKGLIDL
jgi:DNA-binding NarL/FixJ family response regulator